MAKPPVRTPKAPAHSTATALRQAGANVSPMLRFGWEVAILAVEEAGRLGFPLFAHVDRQGQSYVIEFLHRASGSYALHRLELPVADEDLINLYAQEHLFPIVHTLAQGTPLNLW